MIPLTITTNIEETPWPECAGKPFGTITKIGRLPRGTSEGRSTVTVCITLPDGSAVYGQQTLRNMKTAIGALVIGAEKEGET